MRLATLDKEQPTEELKKEVEAFVRKREKPAGGFAATPRLPPTVEDTYFAIRTLEILAALTPETEARTLVFLKNISEVPNQPLVFYRWLWLLTHLKALPADLEPFFALYQKILSRTVSLTKPEGLFALFFSGKILGKPPNSLKELARKRGFRTLADLYHLSRIIPELSTRHLSFVKASLNPDGGYGFFPHTTSFLENVYYAVRLYELSGTEPPEKEKTLFFVKRCFRKGGFARAPGGIPFLESTYYGVFLIKRLESF